MNTSWRTESPGLSRIESAPSSLLGGLVQSLIGEDEFPAGGSDRVKFFPRAASRIATDYCCSPGLISPDLRDAEVKPRFLETYSPYGLDEASIRNYPTPANPEMATVASSLIRQSSSPAGLYSHLTTDSNCELENYIIQEGYSRGHQMTNNQEKSEVCFSGQDLLSHVYEVSIPEVAESTVGKISQVMVQGAPINPLPGGFQMSSWDETSKIVLSGPNKCTKDSSEATVSAFRSTDSQFGLPNTSHTQVEKLLQFQRDFVPCRIRAKRGCATHPRSIAERDRRTRISEKLKKLQELVPNMDKQTHTAEMLDLAAQYIVSLQCEIQGEYLHACHVKSGNMLSIKSLSFQKLQEDGANCTCQSKDDP